MNYTIIKLASQEYKARLDAKACVSLEERIGTNPVNVLLVTREDKLPKLKDLLMIIHASLQQYQHNVTLDDVYKMWDKELESGSSIDKLLEIIVKIFQDSGLITKDEEPEDNI